MNSNHLNQMLKKSWPLRDTTKPEYIETPHSELHKSDLAQVYVHCKPGCVSSNGLDVQVTAKLTHRPCSKSMNSSNKFLHSLGKVLVLEILKKYFVVAHIIGLHSANTGRVYVPKAEVLPVGKTLFRNNP